jgi:hypothetical protein
MQCRVSQLKGRVVFVNVSFSLFSYRCQRRHSWSSAWTIVLFRFRYYPKTNTGRVLMRRFGQRCRDCKLQDLKRKQEDIKFKEEDLEYNTGFCSEWHVDMMIQYLLLKIMRRCYENIINDPKLSSHLIIINTVPTQNGRRGRTGPHLSINCEACLENRCQEFCRLAKT